MTVESATYISQLDSTLPTGSDAKSEGDDHLRKIKSTLKATFPNFGAAALNASNTQLDKLVTTFSISSAPNNALTVDASGNVGINTTPSYRLEANQGGSSGAVVDVARLFANAGSTASARVVFGTTANGVNSGIIGATNSATGGLLVFQTAQEGTGTLTTRKTIDSSGNIIGSVNASAPSLTGNSTMVFSLPSDTQLRVSVRGSDGTTRTTTLTLS